MKKIVLSIVFLVMIGTWVGPTAGQAADWYVRGAVGYERSRAADFSDSDCTAPANLFGCGNGRDGNALGVYGDFGRFPEAEVGVGKKLLPWLRADLAVQYRFNMNYEGQSNFIGAAVGNNQPVSAKADSLSGMVNLFFDVNGLAGINLGRFEPYVGGGVGLAYNRIGEMTYCFPENLGAHKISVMPSGDRTNLAFMLALGTGIVLTEHIVLDIAYRYQDLGRIGTDSGNMYMDTKPAGVAIDKTSAALRTHGVALGLRYRF